MRDLLHLPAATSQPCQRSRPSARRAHLGLTWGSPSPPLHPPLPSPAGARPASTHVGSLGDMAPPRKSRLQQEKEAAAAAAAPSAVVSSTAVAGALAAEAAAPAMPEPEAVA